MSDFENGKRRWGVWTTVALAFGGVALAAVLALAFGFLVMLLWNWLMPTIFHLPAIDYWQGWGLVLLSHILIKPGFHNGGRGPRWGNRGRHQHSWKEHVSVHWGKTPDSEKPETV